VPVACLILKVMLEEMPRHGPKLIEELRRVGAEIDQQAKIELADLYPKDSDKAAPITYLWGAHRRLRVSKLRSRNSAHAVLLAVQIARPQACTPSQCGAAKEHCSIH
jgi:hypothetical protein